MTTERFIRSLASLPKAEALGQIEGFADARRRWGPPPTPEETAALARAKAEIAAGRKPE
jgi:hypothetical protein